MFDGSSQRNRRRNFWQRLSGSVTREPLLTLLLAALLLEQALHPQAPWVLLRRVDWPTLSTLTGLLILAKAVESSGLLSWLAQWLLKRIHTERSLAALLVCLSAGLAMFLTNDVALFAIVPLTLTLHSVTLLPVKRLIIVIALAVNAGSVLTPLGNPQNLFLWQHSGVSFFAFSWAMAPLASILMLLLLGMTWLLFRPSTFTLPTNQKSAPHVDMVLLTATIVAFIIFIGLSDLRYGWFAMLTVVAIYGSWRRDIVCKIDWLLLLIFVLMFIVLRSVTALPAIHTYLASFDLQTPFRVYAASAFLSQGISNVPTAILLAEFTHDWRALAYGVSVGGFGLAIGSMANLIAIRLAALRGVWGPFHLISVLFFLLAGMAGAGLLLVLHG